MRTNSRDSKHNSKNASKMPKNIHKYILDLIMTIIMVLLMKTIFTGLLLHEILGIAVFIMIIVHQLLNLNYTKCLFQSFFKKGIKLSCKIGILIDIALAFVVLGIIITGIIISKELFSLGFSSDLMLQASSLHHSLGYIALILISVHIGIHWSAIMAFCRKIFNLKTFNKARTIALRIITLLIVIAGIKGSFQQNILTKVTEGFTNNDESVVSTTDYTKDLDDEKYAATEATVPKTLEEYLSSLYCTGCSKHCPLSAPKCSVGAEQAQEAKIEYEALVKEAQSSGTTNTSNSNSQTETNTSTGNTTNQSTPVAEEVKDDNIEKDYPGIMTALTDFLPIMGMYVAGTHYLVMIPKYLANKKKE